MDIFDNEILRFWKSLQDNHVKYLMIGGFAINIHGFQRYTADLDIWIEDSTVNRKNLRKALIELDMGDYPSLETMQFVPGWSDFKLNNGLQLDILTNMKGLEDFTFDECLKVATEAAIADVIVPFLNIDHLLQNKKTVNRSKDQIDVIELKRIIQLRKIPDSDQTAS
ncbi:hypothetical protein BH09BAC2_BH09BAC2_18430 [soil metagenome]